MKLSFRLFYGLLLTLGLLRALAYFWYAWLILPSPLEAFHLEAKMVLLAYRAQQGLSLYPEWRHYPHVSNFFGPIYFELVGLIGRAFRADVPGLFGIGRGVTFTAGLGTSIVVGWMMGRRSGRLVGWTSGLLTLGAAPMIGFSVMVRPDVMAEFLAVGGFFLATSRSRPKMWAGGVFLALAILTKQTTGVFLLAAALSWVFEREWRRAGETFLIGLGIVGLVVGLVTFTGEPYFVRSLVGESKSPWQAAVLVFNFQRVLTTSPDLLLLPLVGLGFWLSKANGPREVRMAVLTVVLLASSIGLAVKEGADLNYYLSLRVSEGLAVGAIGRAWTLSRTARRSTVLTLITLLAGLSTLPSLPGIASQVVAGTNLNQMMRGMAGREVRDFYGEMFAMARDPKAKILTDSGLIDLYHGERADFGDPWLFRLQVDTGQYDPREIRKRVLAQYYDLIVTTSELDRPSYGNYLFGFPQPVVEAVRARYARVGSRAGLFLFGRRTVLAPPDH